MIDLPKTQKFKKWKSERMGHPLGVELGFDAVVELEGKIKEVEAKVSDLELAYEILTKRSGD